MKPLQTHDHYVETWVPPTDSYPVNPMKPSWMWQPRLNWPDASLKKRRCGGIWKVILIKRQMLIGWLNCRLRCKVPQGITAGG